jgi:hypothetical protein
MPLPNVSASLEEMLDRFQRDRDNEISALAEVLPQYIQDHNDRAAYREVDRQVNALAKALDRMIAFLRKSVKQADAIEKSVENFYGD